MESSSLINIGPVKVQPLLQEEGLDVRSVHQTMHVLNVLIHHDAC